MRSVELFAGGGGLALGTHLAGFSTELVAEWDARSCQTLRANYAANDSKQAFTQVKVCEGDVRNIDWSGVAPGVDLVSGGPPCQPFSLGGKAMAAEDPRDMFPATAEVIRQLQPRAFMIENVRGLTRAAFTNYFSYIQLRLAHPDITPRQGESWADHYGRLQAEHTSAHTDLQYKVVTQLVNAADYGVPQQRWRVFFVGFRCDVDAEWSFPSPTHSGAALRAIQESGEYWDSYRVPKSQQKIEVRNSGDPQLLPWLTVRDALVGLPEPTMEASPLFFDHVLQQGARVYPGHTGSFIDSPAKALKAGVHGVPGGENMLRRVDVAVRYFSVREAARLQTFPDDYRFSGPWSEAMRQLGNAVPVRLAQIVAGSIQKYLEVASIRTQVAMRQLEFDLMSVRAK